MTQPTRAEARIKSRKPTGQVSWPLVLLEGEEKAGKTWCAYRLTSSDRVGRCFAIDLGEGSADEYGPIGDYDVVEHDGTFVDVLAQVVAIRDFAQEQLDAGEKPVVLILDTMSQEWGILVDAITAKAAQSDTNRRKLAADPAAEVKVPNHLWNDANAKHKRLMTMLMTFPGIVIVTARGKEVAEIKNGAPVEGSKVWKVEGQRGLAHDATVWIRMRRIEGATLEGARSIHCGLRPGVDDPRPLDHPDWQERGLEWFLFDAYQLDPAAALTRDLRDLVDDGIALPEGVQVLTAEEFLAQRVIPMWANLPALEAAYSELNVRGLADDLVVGPTGDRVPLAALVGDRGRELAGVEAPPGAPTLSVVRHQEPRQEPQQAPQEHQEPASEPQGQAQTAPAADTGTGPGSDAPALAGEDEALLAELVQALGQATTLEDARAVWRRSGPVRGIEVEDPQMGRVPFGQVIFAAQKALARPVAEPDHAERAAGDAREPATAGAPQLWTE